MLGRPRPHSRRSLQTAHAASHRSRITVVMRSGIRYDYVCNTFVPRVVSMRIQVLGRVTERHPELSEEDVVTAFRSIMIDAERPNGAWMAVGLDGRGRNVELLYKVAGDLVVIYHAFTPPTKKFRNEIDQLRRRR